MSVYGIFHRIYEKSGLQHFRIYVYSRNRYFARFREQNRQFHGIKGLFSRIGGVQPHPPLEGPVGLR